MNSRKLMLETRAAKQLRDFLRTLTDDAETIADTVEGETNLQNAIQGALKDLDEDEMLANGIAVRLKELSERKDRLEYRIEQRRKAICSAMEAGELQKVTFPEATLSLRVVAPSLEITDSSTIPAEYFVPVEPRLDRNALKAALQSGKTVEGAVLSNGGLSITIRRK